MDSHSKSNGLRTTATSLLKHVPGGALLFAVLPLIALGYFGWRFYGAKHLDDAFYSLRLESLTVTDQPTWIKSNVVKEVFEHNGLERISLLSPQANATIAQAFEAHHWVKSTTRVTKSVGGKVSVDIVYRKPTAWVHYPQVSGADATSNSDATSRKELFYPVDADGIILPVSDFSGQQVLDYFQIYAQGARPTGGVGMPFGDSRVDEALRLCEFLEPHRSDLGGLTRIYVYHDPRSGGMTSWLLAVSTHDHLRQVIWGHSPGTEARAEPKSDAKLQRLKDWLVTASSNNTAEALTLDLRSTQTAERVSFPVQRPN